MWRKAVSFVLLVVLVSQVTAKDEPVVDDKLVGNWKVTTLLRIGVDPAYPLRVTAYDAPADGREAIFSFTGDGKVSLKAAPETGDLIGTYKLLATPGQLTMELTNIKIGTKFKHKCLWQVNGDTLKLAMADDGKDIPTAFNKAPTICICKRKE